MAPSSKPPRKRSPFLLLAGVAALTLFAVSLLIIQPRPTVVEIELVAHRAKFIVVPRPPSKQRAPSSSLLDPSLAVSVLNVRQAVRIEATFPEGRATLVPGLGSVRFTAPKSKSLTPELTLRGPAQITIAPSGEDPTERSGKDPTDGGTRVILELQSPGAASGARVWTGTLPAMDDLTADLHEVELSLGGPMARIPRESRTIPHSDNLLLTGGPGKGEIVLTLPPRTGPATLLRLLDPKTGDLTKPQRLELVTPEPRFIPWGERLVLLEPDPGSAGPHPLLSSDLKIRDPEFLMFSEEKESSLASGQIRFPAGEKEPLVIAPRSLLSLTSDDPLTLRSLGLDGDRLVLVLWGKPASLRLGPTPELQTQILPSRFLWLYTHRLPYLIYTTLASVIGASLALFKLTGLLK